MVDIIVIRAGPTGVLAALRAAERQVGQYGTSVVGPVLNYPQHGELNLKVIWQARQAEATWLQS